jgi:DMSO reductase family type II enzyme heme b subunit
MKAGSLMTAAIVLFLAAAAGAQPVEVRAAYVPEGIASQPNAVAWAEVPESVLILSGQIVIPPIGGGGTTEMRVRAMHDGEWLAIRLDWADPTVDRDVGVDTFRDAAAVGFPLGGPDPLPSPFMGDAEHPVAIWQWTADFEANARGQGGFAERYPHTEGVWYFPQDAVVRREVQAWRGTDPIIEYRAVGYGTLSRRSGGSVAAQSARGKDRWTVVLRRRLQTGDPQDPAFKPGESTQLLTAVWNGSGSEVNGRKSVTLVWNPFLLDATVAADAAP